MRFHRTPALVQWLLPQFTWQIGTKTKNLYLTFDDGPVPEATEFVLDELARVGAKATFFCVGDNIRKHPFLVQRLIREGHRIGNHTHNHLSGWKTPIKEYLANIKECQRLIESMPEASKELPLFRPPYGQITLRQARLLRTEYRLVMWNLLSYDFDPTIAPEHCLRRTLTGTRPGSIVVFHDNIKSLPILRYVLPRYLKQVLHQGYQFAVL